VVHGDGGACHCLRVMLAVGCYPFMGGCCLWMGSCYLFMGSCCGSFVVAFVIMCWWLVHCCLFVIVSCIGIAVVSANSMAGQHGTSGWTVDMPCHHQGG
jgi:hypothetical protein